MAVLTVIKSVMTEIQYTMSNRDEHRAGTKKTSDRKHFTFEMVICHENALFAIRLGECFWVWLLKPPFLPVDIGNDYPWGTTVSISPETHDQLTAYKTPSSCRSLSLPKRMSCINYLHVFYFLDIQDNPAVFLRQPLSHLTFPKVFCLQTLLSNLKMIGVFTS